MVQLILFTSLATFAGYVSIVLMYLLMTFGITAIAPKFVMNRGHFTSGYIFVHPILWIGCGLIGGYVASSIGSPFPYITAVLLAGLITLLIVNNAGDLTTRQALRAKLILSFMAAVGIAFGSYLVLR